MDLSIEFWIQLIIQFIFLSFFAGIVWTKLGYIEEKLDKHNELVERMYCVEEEVDKAHLRVDNIKKDIEDNKE